MHHDPPKPDDLLESDPVWKLLDQTPASRASERFLERTLRVARLEGCAGVPLWRKFLCPVPLAGLCGAAAAVVLLVFLPGSGPGHPPDLVAVEGGGAAEIETFAAIQEAAEMEALLAAVDQMDDFSDHELVTLIGF